jgi:hypothetical protein
MAAKRTTKVTHPDGTVSTRTSVTKVYAFAIEVEEDMHQTAYAKEDHWASLVDSRRRFKAAAAAPELRKVPDRGMTHIYLVDPEAVEDEGKGFYLGHEGGYGNVVFHEAECIATTARDIQARIDSVAKEIDALLSGPQIHYGVVRWSERADSATNALAEFQRNAGYRKYRVVEAVEA